MSEAQNHRYASETAELDLASGCLVSPRATAPSSLWSLRALLVGTWSGTSQAVEGKTQETVLDEVLYIAHDSERALLRLEHLAYSRSGGDGPPGLAHWECSLLRVERNGSLLLSTASDKGCVERLRGRILFRRPEALLIQFDPLDAVTEPSSAKGSRSWCLERDTLRLACTNGGAVPGARVLSDLCRMPAA